jgi:hypothetical protein
LPEFSNRIACPGGANVTKSVVKLDQQLPRIDALLQHVMEDLVLASLNVHLQKINLCMVKAAHNSLQSLYRKRQAVVY